jgi:hypothetical protein
MKRDAQNLDRTLREQFKALRRAEASRAPTYETVRATTPRPASSRAGSRSITGRLAWSALGLLLFLSTVALWTRWSTQSSVEKAIAQARELQTWAAPTDSLLPTDPGIPGAGDKSGGSAPGAVERPSTQPNNRPD